MVGADAVNPGVDFGRVDQVAGGDRGVGLGDHLRLTSQPARASLRGFRRGIERAMGGG